ncbi:hypothetical protein K443DRAFT_682419 [Laccaria amethystina LaAM-08-1]|uniref:Uncharacterized protein n=1 Tax=Laccaria amethystina LaAM-08-1 TaxID=1095629 RepID=A0A0C9X4M4_9AGAR|nr:hypothetical protein K443DRAFT_682419 [Laccaria amethystina LaAM-08-1]
MSDKSSWRVLTIATRLTNVGPIRSSLAHPPDVGISLAWQTLPRRVPVLKFLLLPIVECILDAYMRPLAISVFPLFSDVSSFLEYQ